MPSKADHPQETARTARPTLRCPYCHGHVPLSEPWVACSGCLARHHADCWMGEGGCAACHQGRGLLPANAVVPARDLLRRAGRRRAGSGLGTLLACAALIVTGGLAVLCGQEAAPWLASSGERLTASPVSTLDAEQVLFAAILQAHEAKAEAQAAHAAESEAASERDAALDEAIDWEAQARDQTTLNASTREQLAAARERLGEQEHLIGLARRAGVDFARLRRGQGLAPDPRRAALEVELAEQQQLLDTVLQLHRRSVIEARSLRARLATQEEVLSAVKERAQALAEARRATEATAGLVWAAPFMHEQVRVPEVIGSVLQIQRGALARVLLSVGSEDGLDVGMCLSVYRGSEFVGKVKVDALREETADCSILFLREGQQVRAGDAAATVLR